MGPPRLLVILPLWFWVVLSLQGLCVCIMCLEGPIAVLVALDVWSCGCDSTRMTVLLLPKQWALCGGPPLRARALFNLFCKGTNPIHDSEVMT